MLEHIRENDVNRMLECWSTFKILQVLFLEHIFIYF